MIEKSYQSDFEKGISTLEEIQLLSEFSVSALIGHAYFYLSEMKRKADAISLNEPVKCEEVVKVLDEKLSAIIDDFFGNKNRCKNYQYYKDVENLQLQKWNSILENIPEFLSVVGLFKYHGVADIHFDENGIVVSGFILNGEDVEHSRKLIYVITRKLLRNKILFTFNLSRVTKNGLFKLDLKMDISHDENFTYRVPFKVKEDECYALGFPNMFYRYRISWEKLKLVGEHNIVEINNDFSVEHYFGLPELTCTESAKKEILHFPFIFRPFSIILPMKGSLDDNRKRRQDVSKNFHSIDFFSLFNL